MEEQALICILRYGAMLCNTVGQHTMHLHSKLPSRGSQDLQNALPYSTEIWLCCEGSQLRWNSCSVRQRICESIFLSKSFIELRRCFISSTEDVPSPLLKDVFISFQSCHGLTLRFFCQDRQAEEAFKEWQQNRWQREAQTRGITEPEALQVFIAERKAIEKKASALETESAHWPLAYRLYLRDKSQSSKTQASLVSVTEVYLLLSHAVKNTDSAQGKKANCLSALKSLLDIPIALYDG